MHPTKSDHVPILINVFMILCFIVPAILFMLTQQNTLKVIRRENRLMHPGLVWLQFIPVFGQVWQFIVVSRIAGSAALERLTFRDSSILGLPNASTAAIGKRPTLLMGITYCVLEIINVSFMFTTLTPTTQAIQIGVAMAQLTCWIIYWVQLDNLKRMMKRANLIYTIP